MKVFIVIRKDYYAYDAEPAVEVEAYPTLEAAIKDIHDFYFDDGKEDAKLWKEMKNALTTEKAYFDEDNIDPIQWVIYEKEF